MLDVGVVFPLSKHALYISHAAEHWSTLAKFGEVSPRLRKGMIDADKPHFKVWLKLTKLCGFHDLVEYLIIRITCGHRTGRGNGDLFIDVEGNYPR